MEHLECGYQPHAQDRGAEKRLQLAGRSGSGYGLESPSPGGARSQGKGRKVNTGLRGLVPCTGFPLNCRTPPLLGANEHTTLYSTHVHRYALCVPARLRSPSPFFLPPGRALGSSRSLARLPGVTRLPLQSFLMPLPRLWPRLRFAFDWYRSLRERRRPSRGLPGRGRWHWVTPTSTPGRSSPLSLVGESCPHSRPLYRPWLAPPSAGSFSGSGRRGSPCRRSR